MFRTATVPTSIGTGWDLAWDVATRWRLHPGVPGRSPHRVELWRRDAEHAWMTAHRAVAEFFAPVLDALEPLWEYPA